MPRYFVDFRLHGPEAIDFDASDLWGVLAIRELANGFEIERTTFDFSIDIVDPHRANNRIHTLVERRAQIDGLVRNVLQPGRRTREVDAAEYAAICARLEEKSAHLWRKKRRQPVRTQARGEAARPRLP